MKTYATGKMTWTHGSRMPYDRRHCLLGPCPVCGGPTFDYGGGWRCLGNYCSCSYSNPAPSVGPVPHWWNADINVFLDGDAWCATKDDFVNLQESPAGFGKTPREAVDALSAEVLA